MKHGTSFGGWGYTRAWEIINNIEGYQAFVNDLIGNKNLEFYKPINLLDKFLLKANSFIKRNR